MHSSLFVTLLVGAVAGWLAGLIVRGSGYGIIGDVIIGLLGGFAGTYLLTAIGKIPHFGSPLLERGVVAFVGALVLLLLVGLLRPRSIGERISGLWRRR